MSDQHHAIVVRQRRATTVAAACIGSITLAALVTLPYQPIRLPMLLWGFSAAMLLGLMARFSFDRSAAVREGSRLHAVGGPLVRALVIAVVAAAAGLVGGVIVDSCWPAVGAGPVSLSVVLSLRSQIAPGLGSS